jgi:hypothetical protein
MRMDGGTSQDKPSWETDEPGRRGGRADQSHLFFLFFTSRASESPVMADDFPLPQSSERRIAWRLDIDRP